MVLSSTGSFARRNAASACLLVRGPIGMTASENRRFSSVNRYSGGERNMAR
jgi:hypothetical protein